MHIPDGFIAPVVYLPAYGVAIGCWAFGLRRLKRDLNEHTLPRLAMLTALAFVLQMVHLPLPGGTSVHATGVGMLAVIYGVWTTFIAITLVLLLQALLFANGGITALPINALAMGLIGAAAARGAFSALRPVNTATALFSAGWLSVVLPATLVALVLGLQPEIARSDDGMPLFFPFGPGVTLPAVVIPHAVIGVAEGILTLAVFKLAHERESRS